MPILISKDAALSELAAVLSHMPQNTVASNPPFQAWRQRALIVLGTIWGDDSSPVKQFDAIGWSTGIIRRVSLREVQARGSRPTSEELNEQRDAFCAARLKAVELLNGLYRRVESLPDAPPPESYKPPEVVERTNRVFIVHGHDAALRQAVARYVSALGFREVILMEEPNRGRTVIEKFEEEAKADFAVVLATADDMAESVKALKAAKPNETLEALNLRARQNVVFELGYFMAKLGRGAVMLVTDSGVELPSDLAGVIYTQRQEVVNRLWHELDAFGFKFTMDQIKAATRIVL